MKDREGQWLNFDAAIAAVQTDWRIPAELRAGAPAVETDNRRTYPMHISDDLLGSVEAANVLARGARLPRRGEGHFIYVAEMDGLWAKIGFSTNPVERLKTLNEISPLPLRPVLISPGTIADEQALHAHFADQHLKNEWFRIGGELAIWLRRLPQHRREHTFRRTSD